VARLKLEDVRQEIEAEDWKLLSETYTNLDTDMKFECPEGHAVYTTLKKWRRSKYCPTCADNPLKSLDKHEVGKKQSGVLRVLAMDDATETSGWSLFDGDKLVAAGAIHMGQNTAVARIAGVRQWLLSAIEKWQPDKVAIEDIQLQSFYNQKKGEDSNNVKLFKTLAHLQGVLLNTLYEQKIECIVVHVSTWRSYCGITAKTRTDQKNSAKIKVKMWYDANVTDDVAEAICLGKYIAEKYVKNNILINWGEGEVW
jgi:Holliday junction resolvasome RuvABC endonuclease subunit